MKKSLIKWVLLADIVAVVAIFAFFFNQKMYPDSSVNRDQLGKLPKVKYVFLFIGDGMSTPQRMIAEEFSRLANRGELVINHMDNHATTRTVSANAIITDSAAAATAIACGTKTYNGAIGVDSNKQRIESVAEVAKKAGKKVGIITSVTLNHATPAGFYGHQPGRNLYYMIGLDLIASDFDFFGGGGISDFNHTKNPNYKGNIYDLAKEKGYTVAIGKDEIRALDKSTKKVIAASSLYHPMVKAIDQKDGDLTLAEITALGIEKLDNPNGFFMMIEGGQIDWDGHANRSAENLREVLAFDDAVKVALEFAKNHPDETLVVVTGDHETGGMAMGLSGTALRLDRLGNQKCSSDVFAGILKKEKENNANYSLETVKELITKYYGLTWDVDKGDMNVYKDQMDLIEKGFENGKLPEYLRRIMNTKAGIGWTSGGHTALPVLTTATGVNSDAFSGFIENIDISKKLKSMM